jgi:hypothetical protein
LKQQNKNESMKKIILAAAVLGMAAVGMDSAKAGVHFGFSFGIPAPVIVAPAPRVVYAPAPPVYCEPPAPVVVYREPAYCPPPVCYDAPVVRFGFGFRDRDRDYHWRHEYREHHEYRGHHGRW